MAQRIVGLDIGTGAVRAVELTLGDGSRPVLEAFGQVALPRGAVEDGEIHDRGIVAAAIQRLWTEGGFTERKVTVGVAGLRAITRELDMPVLPPDELDDAVRFQADEVVPFPLDRTAISAKVIAQFTDPEGTPTLRVLVAAAHRDLIDSIVATVLAAGLDPVRIDLNTAALVRALHDPTFSGGPEAIVSVGASLTMVVVHEGGTLQFVRTIDLGGDSVTTAIGAALDVPASDAEALKLHLIDGPAVDVRARSAAEQAVDELVEEVRNSVRFFASLPGRSSVARVLVTGGGAQTVGFLEKLEHSLDIPVRPAASVPIVDMTALPITEEEAAAITPTLPVPVGLALPDLSGRPFNLVPPEVETQQTINSMRKYALIGAIGVAVLLVLLTVLQVLKVQHAQNQVKSLQAQNTYLEVVKIPKYNKTVALKNQIVAQQKLIKPLLTTEVDWLVVLNQLGEYTLPTAQNTVQSTWSTLTLDTLLTPASSAKSKSKAPPNPVLGTLEGSVQTVGLPGVSDLVTSLQQSPAFNNVEISGSLTPSPDGTVNTALTIDINQEASTQRLSLIETPVG
jgi:type IV pilus assembly protein PilM